MNTRYPVAIVGAGPAGLTLANLLGTYGVRTLLLERNPSTVSEPRAVSIDDETLRALQACGLDQVALADIVQGYGLDYYTPSGSRFAQVRPQSREFGFPKRNAFRQPVLEAQLRKGLERFPHVEARFRHRLESFTQSADGVRVQLTGPDGPVEIECDWLVGCDGASSRVRESLGIVLGGSTFVERWLIVDLEGTPDRYRHTRVYCDPKRPAINLPGPHGTRRYEFMLHPGEDAEAILDEGRVRAMVAERVPGDRDLAIVRKVVYTFHARIADRWKDGRVMIAGDAAHLSPPFAGQGMNSGQRDVFNLAWKLAAVTAGRIGPGLLDTYERERRDHAWALIEMAVNIGRVMQPKTALGAFLVQNGMRLLSLYPPARDYLMQMKYKPKPRFHEGFVVPDGLAGDESLSGRLFPQPMMETSAGAYARLDDLSGAGFALLLCGEGADRKVAVPALPPELAARVLRVIPADDNFPLHAPEPGVDGVLRDAQGVVGAAIAPFAATAGPAGVGVLLRPDCYVAAVIPLGAPAAALDALQKRIAATLA